MADSSSSRKKQRERNAAKSFAEKVRILEELRDRDRVIRAARATVREEQGRRKN